MHPDLPWEIERVFLLRGMPAIPGGAAALRIEQGYLREDRQQSKQDEITEGRVRRAVMPDGSVECTHTIKRGLGRVRQELEQRITPEQFAELWPRTVGRRLSKTRHKVREGELVWEVDEFDDLDLVLAEVELPAQDTPIAIPAWLAPHVVREVTEEPEYRNFALALRVGLMRGG